MLNDVGILKDSVRYYHDADAFTASYLYSIPHAGIYHCDAQYDVDRSGGDACLDVCQIIWVDEGELAVDYQGETLTAPPGSIVLLNCRRPHRYYSRSDSLRLRWFHFVGNSSEAYTDLIVGTHSVVLPVAQNAEIEACCRTIMMAVHQNQPNPHALSVTIHKLLVLLVLLLGEPEKGEIEQAIQDSADYIETHYADKALSIDFLAQKSALSKCYYLRKFKEYQSMTPHQFLQAARLRAAKQQLTTTSRSMEEIAERCGFCNTSHFIMTFRKSAGLTPLQFRTRWK